MDSAALNYNPDANTDDNLEIVEGCDDANALNYDPNANTDDGSCIEIIGGLYRSCDVEL